MNHDCLEWSLTSQEDQGDPTLCHEFVKITTIVTILLFVNLFSDIDKNINVVTIDNRQTGVYMLTV